MKALQKIMDGAFRVNNMGVGESDVSEIQKDV